LISLSEYPEEGKDPQRGMKPYSKIAEGRPQGKKTSPSVGEALVKRGERELRKGRSTSTRKQRNPSEQSGGGEISKKGGSPWPISSRRKKGKRKLPQDLRRRGKRGGDEIESTDKDPNLLSQRKLPWENLFADKSQRRMEGMTKKKQPRRRRKKQTVHNEWEV